MDDFAEKLHRRFPKIYGENADVCIDSGWQNIIFQLSLSIQNRIDFVNARHEKYPDLEGEPIEQVVVAQIKEKFGGLRFYYDGGDDYIAGLVEMAESWAGHTCEVCGQPGKSRDLSWLKTLCEEHYHERQKM